MRGLVGGAGRASWVPSGATSTFEALQTLRGEQMLEVRATVEELTALASDRRTM